MPGTTYSFDQIAAMIQSQGQAYGLSQDQIDAAKTIARAEGGWTGAVGDNGTSFGLFQFHAGGMLDSFAAWLGTDLATAGQVAIEQPDLAIEFALQPGGYLNQALQAGAQAGNSGLNLALYAEQFGQRAAQDASGLLPSVVANVTSAWTSLFGTSTSTTTTTTPTDKQKQTPFPLPSVSDVPSGLAAIAASITNAAAQIQATASQIQQFPSNAARSALAPITSLVRLGEQLFWILIGLAFVLAGLWLTVQSETTGKLAAIAETAASNREKV